MLVRLLADLCERLDKQTTLAMSLKGVAEPSGDTPWGEYRWRKVFEIALAELERGIRDVERFAKIIHENAARGGRSASA
jgi:hypothetical protein